MILSGSLPDSSLQGSIKHFMCTLLDVMELVRNMGQRNFEKVYLKLQKRDKNT